MKKFIKLSIILTIFTSYIASAQSNVSEASFKDGDAALYKFLNKKFSEEVKKNTINICLTSAVFAKFSVDSLGYVKSISFSETGGTPEIFKKILTNVILATNGLWLPRTINGKAILSKPFILPLIYDLEAGCNPQTLSSDSLKRAVKPIPNGLDTALRYILKFEDNNDNITQLDCILISPLRIFSIN